MLVVEAQDLAKRYDGVQAVQNLNLEIREREIYGLLGPNGSGKTTTILILLGLTEPTSGKVQVCGRNPTRNPIAVKRLIGYLPENVGFYDDLTAQENLRLVARLNKISDRRSKDRIAEILKQVGLAEVARRPVRTFSRGMLQRLGIADVLIKDPRFVILDEPTSGIDPEGATQILDMIVRMRDERGMTIMLASHLLHQVQRICDRVGILHRGQLVAQGSLDELSAEAADEDQELEVRVAGTVPELTSHLQVLEGVSEVESMGDRLRIRCREDVQGRIARAVMDVGAELLELRRRSYTLEDIYLRYFQE